MADLIIRGMEMPKRCVGCPLFVCEIGDPMSCLVGYRRLDERNVSESRPDCCPLVPLPAGHGRLIDADALLEKLMKTSRYFGLKFDIDDAPTIVSAEGGTDNG